MSRLRDNLQSMLVHTGLTLREAQRRKMIWVVLGLGSAFIVLYSVGLYYAVRDMRAWLQDDAAMFVNTGFNMLVMAGLYVINFMVMMLAVLSSVGVISSEISSHVIQTLAVKPAPRWTLILGKWLGLILMLAATVLFLGGGILLSTYLVSGYLPDKIPMGLTMIWAQGVVMLTLAIWGGARMSTVANGVLCFMLYGLAFIGSWLEQIGAAITSEVMVDIGIVTSLIVPSETLWRAGAYAMQPPVITSLGLSPFSSGNPPSAAMMVYSLLYVMACLIGAVRTFQKRDL